MSDPGFWSSVISTAIGAAAGALLAFQLEHWRRNVEQKRDEISHCHLLLCLLVNRLNVLEDFHEQLFVNFEKKHRRPPNWHETGSLDGAPDRADDIPIGNYRFLMDGRTDEGEAATLLRGVQLSTNNTNALFARIAHRNRLWRAREDVRPQAELQIGPDGAQARLQLMSLERALEERTIWMRQDLEEEIPTVRGILDLFYRVMNAYFPNEKILHARPKAGGPPLGYAGGAGPPPKP